MLKQNAFRLFGVSERFFSFRAADSGSISALFACALMALMGMVGAAVDLGNAYMARQKLSQVSVMTCQYANRSPIVANSVSSGSTYTNQVNQFISSSLAKQAFPYTQSNETPFTFSAGGGAAIALTASVPTHFMKIMGVNSIPISVTMNCYSTPNVKPPQQRRPGTYALREQFNTAISTNAGKSAFYMPSGVLVETPTTAQPSPTSLKVSYTGMTGINWYVTGYCMEQNASGFIAADSPDSTPSIELDCEDGAHGAGNSSISTPVDLDTGTYELRYFYNSRIFYDNYHPVTLCASSASDLAWANDSVTTRFPAGMRSNQVNVYLDKKTGAQPPTHVTLDGQVTLAGSNLIDHCVYSSNWVERSVKITVTTAGTFWLTFAADGANDSFGGMINNVRLCYSYCPGAVQDSYPTSWANDKTLFADVFDSVRTPQSPQGFAARNSTADIGESTATLTSGWPSWVNGAGLVANTWAAASKNIVTLWQWSTGGCPEPTKNCLALNYNSKNTSISRPFLLPPGYYEIVYVYQSSFTYVGVTGTYCGPTPVAANYVLMSALTGIATNRFAPNWRLRSNPADNTIAVFASHAGLVSTPNVVRFNTTTTYMNPGSNTASATATYPPDTINLSAYDSRQRNPLIDICTFSSSAVVRRVPIKITKPAYYWITFASFSSTSSVSGALSNVLLNALGSPYMTPPSGAITVPVPNPQPNSIGVFTGFTTVQNDFAP